MRRRALAFALFFVAHSLTATGLAFILAWIFGGLSPFIAGVSLLISFLRGRRFVTALQNSLEWRAPEVVRPWATSEFAIAFFALFAAWKHFAWLMPNMSGAGGPAITTLSLTNYGDLPLHVNYIRALAGGLDFIPLNPIFALEPLRYPFGPDLYNALWECLGFSMTGHLFVAGMAATFASLVLLRELGGAWAMAAFFLAGGSAVADGANAVDWKSFFLAIWITQRGMLWALPMGLTLLLYLRPHLSNETRLPRRAVSSLGRMWAIFPLFHAHSFVVVSLLLFFLVWKDFGIRKTREFLSRFFLHNRALAWALLPATFLIHHTSAGFSKASILRWRAGWLLPEGASFEDAVSWIWKNFGFSVAALIAMGVLTWVATRRHERNHSGVTEGRRTRSEILILSGFFVLFLFVMVAPWEWDNIKVLIWPWILLFGLLGRAVIRLSANGRPGPWEAVTLLGIAIAFHAGTLAVARSWTRPQEKSTTIWRVEELNFAETAILRVPRKAVFAAAPTPTHVLTYFGRLRVLGYQGHLWSHAIAYHKEERALETLMTGAEGWVEAAKSLKITHIYWGPEERSKWGVTDRTWQTRLPRVAKAGDHEVYEFKEAR